MVLCPGCVCLQTTSQHGEEDNDFNAIWREFYESSKQITFVKRRIQATSAWLSSGMGLLHLRYPIYQLEHF
jgi:hypothetical protein